MSANAALQRPAAGHVDGVQGAQPSPQGPGTATDLFMSWLPLHDACCSSGLPEEQLGEEGLLLALLLQDVRPCGTVPPALLLQDICPSCRSLYQFLQLSAFLLPRHAV